jgi:hypothetical protein
MMTNQAGRFRRRLLCLGAVVLATPPALALDVSNNVAFSAIHLSPWAGGPAIDLQNEQTISKSFNINLPAVNPDPVKALADFLGVPLPFDASVSLGAHTDGTVALDFGYAVTAGRFNVTYPAIGTLSIPTATGTNKLSSQTFTLGSSFQPGLQQSFVPSVVNLALVAGGGYTLLPGAGLSSTKFQDPLFTTSFPSFAAWADVWYDVHAGASINADLKVLGQCIVCASKSVTLGDSQFIPIVDINGAGVNVLGQTVAQLSGTFPIVPGEVSVTVSVPNLKVGSAPLPAGSTTLTGSGAQSIIQVNMSLEKLVPVIGAFLSNTIGPFGYNLLSVDGGPNLGLYQNFSFAPDPKAVLNFSQTMLVQGSDGVYRPTNTALFDLGAPLNIKVPMGTQDIVTVQPTYILENRFSNETGITLGATLNVSGLTLTSSFGDLGPAFSEPLIRDPFVHIPLYNNSFEEPLGSITPDSFTLDVGAHLGELFKERYSFSSAFGTGPGMFDVRFRDNQTGGFADVFTPGQTVTTPRFCGPNIEFCPALSILQTDHDLMLGGFDIGNAFCIFCIEATGPLGSPSPSVTDDLGNVLFLTDLSEFPSGECESSIGICDGTLAAANRGFDPVDPTTTQVAIVGDTIVISDVPEPGVPWLLAGASAAWLAVRLLQQARRRTSHPRFATAAPPDASG